MKTVFIYEWKKLLRQPVQLLSLLIFCLLSLYSMWTGRLVIEEQRETILSIKEAYEKDFNEVSAKFEPNDTTAAAKRDARFAKRPLMLDYWLPQNAINEPSSLAILSIGERDILPLYYKVKTTVDYLDRSNTGIDNPMMLWVGNFDFSFVLIYLLPLLIIIFSYDIISSESETGTHRIISIQQGAGIANVALSKLLFRTILIGSLTWLLIGVAFANAVQVDSLSMWLWIVGSLSYLLFWFALCFLVISWQWGTHPNLIILFSGWLLYVILWPSCATIYVNGEQPVPLRTSVASYKRAISEELWRSDKKDIVDSFLLYNPQYKRFYNDSKVQEASQWGHFEMAGYYDLLEKRVARHAAPFEKLLENRRRTASRLNHWNPVIQMQNLYNGLARTSVKDHREFEKNVLDFQKDWKDFIYSFQLAQKDMAKENLLEFPVFKQNNSPLKADSVTADLSLLWGWILLFILGGIAGYKTKG